VRLPLGDYSKIGKITIVIEQQMQLYRSLGTAEPRPVIHAQAHIYHGRIKTQKLVLEPKLVPLLHRLPATPAEKLKKYTLIKFIGPVFVGIRKRRMARRFLHPYMPQLTQAGLQSATYLPQ